ncbi:MAG TPA: type II toxin-antitoxin system VapC family toxin [Gemmatimonadales bacterium]|nr:type II toxin-antitoxin system VapC family toxin [Gemmatimonadales bacterium]
MTPTPRLLLDTHFWIWSLQGETNRISPSVAADLNAAAREGRLLVHTISVWEVGMLVRKRRITLDRPVRQWIDEALHMPGVRVAEFTPEIAIEAALLDAAELNDPVDRFLVAAAQVLGATLVTQDRMIVDWARGGGIRILS